MRRQYDPDACARRAPLDTAVGTERPTVQLVDIEVRDGEYSFAYPRLDRYMSLALEKGMKYFEISHLFSQVGRPSTRRRSWRPSSRTTVRANISAFSAGRPIRPVRRYKKFIRAFVSALLAHLKEKGLDHMCWFHISDEPTLEQLESYKAAKALVSDLLEGYHLMDALSKRRVLLDRRRRDTDSGEQPYNAVPRESTCRISGHIIAADRMSTSRTVLSQCPARARVFSASSSISMTSRASSQWGFNFWGQPGLAAASGESVRPNTTGDYFVPAGRHAVGISWTGRKGAIFAARGSFL